MFDPNTNVLWNGQILSTSEHVNSSDILTNAICQPIDHIWFSHWHYPHRLSTSYLSIHLPSTIQTKTFAHIIPNSSATTTLYVHQSQRRRRNLFTFDCIVSITEILSHEEKSFASDISRTSTTMVPT